MIDLKRCRLYGILDLGYVQPAEALAMAERLLAGGVDILQLRAKRQSAAEIAELAERLHSLTRAAGVPLIINDYPEIARAIGAEGVHVGQDDLSLAAVRAVMGREGVVGRSTHSLAQARTAVAEGADYIGFGPLFATPTKPDYAAIGLDEIAAVHAAVSVPIFCIGGIKLENLPGVIAAGARRVVIVSGLLQAPDVAEYARSAKALLHPDPSPPRQQE
ncbi:MAG: thiamine phosphate synthase [Chthoniobacterales bacterium]